MPEVTEEEWKASKCFRKSKFLFHYHLCRACGQRLKDPSCDEPCDGAPHPLCPSMKEGEPTIKEVLADFALHNTGSATGLLTVSMSHCWHCHECEYWEDKRGGQEEAFITTHGASLIPGEISEFCSYFIIRKCVMRESQKRETYTIMSKLMDYMFEKGHIDVERKKAIERDIKLCRSVNGDKIVEALEKLHAEGYWKSLEEAVAEDEDGELNVKPSAKKQRTDTAAGKGDGEDDLPERTICSDFPIEVKEVTEDSWIFQPVELRWNRGGYSSDDEGNGGEEIPVKLPKGVAKLGKKGMEISCMGLQCRRGIWSPFNPYYEDQVCANVYPPSS